ncbi:beta-lactamase family protein [Nostoc sp. KVJ20]|uniref:beta-lactamase family protein n=1 Tax=Nostoc sp. KVJ20 TaxID=457944 RepID=UPI00114D1277|nr:beta-lactamase family protein [Nostoc sp. KVJ20]
MRLEAIAALQLVEAGKINLDVLDVSVKQYLPDFTLADTQTADQIVNHCEV